MRLLHPLVSTVEVSVSKGSTVTVCHSTGGESVCVFTPSRGPWYYIQIQLQIMYEYADENHGGRQVLHYSWKLLKYSDLIFTIAYLDTDNLQLGKKKKQKKNRKRYKVKDYYSQYM